jgi:hypothetical protein
MIMVDMIATKTFPYRGKTIDAGRKFEASSDDIARTLVALKRAKYSTRRMMAEDIKKPEAPATATAPAVTKKPNKKKGKPGDQKYPTRDMTAKD